MKPGRALPRGGRIPAIRAGAFTCGIVAVALIGWAWADMSGTGGGGIADDRLFLLARMLEIHREMGLGCGCSAPLHEAGGETHADLDSVYGFAKRQTARLVAEAQRRLARGETRARVLDYLSARTAGYTGVAEMRRDLARVLGHRGAGDAASLYLVLRRMERYGLAGRQRDFERLRAELRALGVPPAVSDLRRLLDTRWRQVHGTPAMPTGSEEAGAS